MSVYWVGLLAGLLILSGGAEFLVRGGAALAIRLGLSPLAVGLTVVAFGTSAPELLVSVQSVMEEYGDIAVGNVVGSNIFNIAAILGLAAVICPLRIQSTLIRFDIPVMIAVTLALSAALLFFCVPQWGGVLLILLLGAYTWFIIRMARREQNDAVGLEFQQAVPGSPKRLWADLVLVALGLAMLGGGAKLFVDCSVGIARSWGISEAVIGLTLVSAGTSLPELATSVVAALRRQPDMAVGNIVGSNIFNLLGIFGVSAALRPLNAPGIGLTDLGVMTVCALVLLPVAWSGQRISRMEGVFLLSLYVAYVWLRWPN